MDSDAEGIPSEFFDYFKVSIPLFCSLKISNKSILLTKHIMDSGSLHTRFSHVPQACRANNPSCGDAAG